MRGAAGQDAKKLKIIVKIAVQYIKTQQFINIGH